MTSIAIIGAGFGGLGAAIELKRSGFEDIVIFEKGDDVGGTWRENTYPGAACDVPSPFYSYSYEPNPNWPHRFSRQPAILAYIQDVAKVQIWCAFAEVLLGEANFAAPVS